MTRYGHNYDNDNNYDDNDNDNGDHNSDLLLLVGPYTSTEI
jgi:hypothetical protein